MASTTNRKRDETSDHLAVAHPDVTPACRRRSSAARPFRRRFRRVRGLAVLAGLLLTHVAMANPWNEQTYAPSDAVIANPERGLYVQFTLREPEDALPQDALADLRKGRITLILRLYYLNAFRERPIDDQLLATIADDFDKLRKAGLKCVLRFAYNERIGDPDASIDVVLHHLEQLKPILARNADVIAVAQAGFVGSWGEWHASTNGLHEPENAKRIISAWLDVLPAARFVQVRTPALKRMLVETDTALEEAQAYTPTSRARIAHHNDCFLASETDFGTYQADIEEEKRYLALETRFGPMGGETCHVSPLTAENHARDELQRFHWSYLNRDYHPEVIGAWRESGFLGEIEKRLGYRIVLNRVKVRAQAPAGGNLDVQIDLENTGWAPPFNPREVEVVLRSRADGSRHHALIDTDPRRWMPGEAVRLATRLRLRNDMPQGAYDLLLWLPDPEPALRDRPAYAIRLANRGLWQDDSGMHDLGVAVEVTAPQAVDTLEVADGVFAPPKPED